MLSHGPLSAMPLSSVPRWRRTRVVVVRCIPEARLQTLHRAPIAKEGTRHVDVDCQRIGAATAYMVPLRSGSVCGVVVVNRPNTQQTPNVATMKRWEAANTICSRVGQIALETTRQIELQVVQFGATPIDTTDELQPDVAKGDIRAKPYNC